jgi:NADH-quinone oxidoreductase subunit N
VYDGASVTVAAFLSVGPKVAGLVALLRVVSLVLPSDAPFTALLPLVAMATMTFGNLAALAQERVQRLLAYSGVAQVGYLLAALCAGPPGASALLVYAIAYAAMNLGVFAVACCLDRMGFEGGLLDWRGLGRRAPWLGVPLACFVFSLVGLPPFAGFFGKYGIVSALLNSKVTPVAGALAVAVVINSVVSLAYYARLLRVMFLETSSPSRPLSGAGRGQRVVLWLCAALTIGFAFISDGLGARLQQAGEAARMVPTMAPAVLRLPGLN